MRAFTFQEYEGDLADTEEATNTFETRIAETEEQAREQLPQTRFLCRWVLVSSTEVKP